MKIVDPSVTLSSSLSKEHILNMIEHAGRTAYKSEPTGDPELFLAKIMSKGHLSVIEHISLTFDIICDRGISHEIVRHRLFSYTQESTRYCKYDGDIEFIMPITFIKNVDKTNAKYEKKKTKPKEFYANQTIYHEWINQMKHAEASYERLLNLGVSTQNARSVLPNSLKTKIVMTGNLRNWLHFIELRTSKSAHPDMRVIANMIKDELQNILPEIFGEKE